MAVMSNVKWICQQCGKAGDSTSPERFPKNYGRCPVTGYDHVWAQV